VSRIAPLSVARWWLMHRKLPARGPTRPPGDDRWPATPGDGGARLRTAKLACIARTTLTAAARPQAGPTNRSQVRLPLSQCRSNTRRSASP